MRRGWSAGERDLIGWVQGRLREPCTDATAKAVTTTACATGDVVRNSIPVGACGDRCRCAYKNLRYAVPREATKILRNSVKESP